MGFVASEQVEQLDYDFRPHAEVSGTIPEPTTRQVDDFRNAIFTTLQASGLDPEQLSTGKVNLAMLGDLMEKGSAVEKAMVTAVADLTGIPDRTLDALPYRIKAAFVGWITGQFFDPEA